MCERVRINYMIEPKFIVELLFGLPAQIFVRVLTNQLFSSRLSNVTILIAVFLWPTPRGLRVALAVTKRQQNVTLHKKTKCKKNGCLNDDHYPNVAIISSLNIA